MAECCSGGTKFIYACSGAVDVGEIADQVVRRLRVHQCRYRWQPVVARAAVSAKIIIATLRRL